MLALWAPTFMTTSLESQPVPAWLQRLDRWQRRLPLTHEGKIWLLFSLAMFLTGLWRSINLITLLSSFLLVILFVNWFLARRQLKKLRGQMILASAPFARRPNDVTLEVFNGRTQAVGSFWLRLQDRAWLVPQLGPKQTRHVPATITFPRRGRDALSSLRARTGFPLGLANVERDLLPGQDLIVLPALGNLERGMLRRLLYQQSPTIGLARTVPRRHPSAQTDFHGLRPYQPGDTPRWIHWRTSARCGELMVREFEETPSENLILIVDPFLGDEYLLERAISLAATICWECCRQKGDRLILGIAGREPGVCQGVTSTELAFEMLEKLALEPGTNESTVAPLLDRLNIPQLPAAPILLISSRECPFLDELEQAFHRPCAVIHVGDDESSELFKME